MDSLLDFARGPLFRFAFVLMILGLLRHLGVAILEIRRAYARAGDRNVPRGAIWRRTWSWLIPWRHLLRSRPVYSVLSVVFHVGVILVPIFLFAHIRLWEQSVGISWYALALPRHLADTLTAVVVLSSLGLVIGRLTNRASRFLSGPMDYLLLGLLAACFAAGFLAAHPSLNPMPYKAALAIHVLVADLLFVLVPFTKLAHCVLFPLSYVVGDVGWRFPADSGTAVEAALGKKGVPI